jgi:hypothetical protein
MGLIGTLTHMTVSQTIFFRAAVEYFRPVEFHFGNEIGCDGHAHIAITHTIRACVIHEHPAFRTWCRAHRYADVHHPPGSVPDRNRAIIDASTVVIVTPKTETYDPESYTWPAVRLAAEKRKPVYVIGPQRNPRRYSLEGRAEDRG